MHRATYSFKNENVKMVAFKEGDLLVVLKENENGWWLCQAINGRIGLVPSNFIEPHEPEPSEVVDFADKAASLAPNHKPFFFVDYLPLALSVLEKLKQQFSTYKHSSNTPQQASPISSPLSSSPPSSSSLPPTPQPLSLCHVQPKAPCDPDETEGLASKLNQDNSINNIPTSKSPPLLKSKVSKLPNNLFWSMVTKVRERADVNFESSRNVLKLVLSELSLAQPSWIEVIDSLLAQENINIDEALNTAQQLDKEDDTIADDDDDDDGNGNGKSDEVLDIKFSLQHILLSSKDSFELCSMMQRVEEVVEDGQQSSWYLVEDLQANSLLLQQLLHILRDANESLCSNILKRNNYAACYHLVQYYQMESRTPLRRLLVQVFMRVCELEDAFISELLTSVLPMELARQLISADTHVGLGDVISLLCILLSTAETLSHQHYSCFDLNFLTHVLNLIEQDQALPHDEESSEKLIQLFMHFNLHFTHPPDNCCMQALRQRCTHKQLTEHLLLLFNRGGSLATSRPTIKFLIDIFSHPSTAHIFYTNDANVLVDIIYRQVNDLSDGDEERTEHLKLLHLFLLHSDYWEHPHRQADIHQAIQQIQMEEMAGGEDRDISQQILKLFEKYEGREDYELSVGDERG